MSLLYPPIVGRKYVTEQKGNEVGKLLCIIGHP